MKTKKNYFIILSWITLVCLNGCATVSEKEAFLTYKVGGITYFPLIELCEAKNIRWHYEPYTKVFELRNSRHSVVLRPGEKLVLFDNEKITLNQPVTLLNGAVLIPLQLKEKILKTFPFSEPEPVCPLNLRKIVIDAGHGGKDPGAIGRSGLQEKRVALDIAHRLRDILTAAGIEILMTRAKDEFISLPDRVKIVNSSNADIFISIHANANRSRALAGFEVYYVSDSLDDTQRALAASENETLGIDKNSFASDSPVLKRILWDMLYTQTRKESVLLGKSIAKAVGTDLEAEFLGLKGARFQVLKGSSLPAVLIEVGYLSNPNEESLLKQDYYHQRLAECIAHGIRNYADNLLLTEAALQ